MTKPKATWVLWIERDNGGFKPSYSVTPLAGWCDCRDMLRRYVTELTGFDIKDCRILPAGRVPK